MNKITIRSLCVFLSILALYSASADYSDAVTELQHDWAKVNYALQGDEQNAAFEALADKATSMTQQHPGSAEVWIWDGIVKSTYAGAKGGLGALSLAKQSRKSLEKAMSIDDKALSGSAYTSLGTLYFKVPGWPAGFGSNKKAEAMLQKALMINPDGIDANYFFADFMRDRKHYAEAEKYLLKAQHANPRPERPLADEGRQKEIELALAEVRNKLKGKRQAEYRSGDVNPGCSYY